MEGLPSWANALALFHSHPAVTFIQQFPNFRMTPTSGEPGDWGPFNEYQTMIRDAMLERGHSLAEAEAKANSFVQFIYGAAAPISTDLYGLYRYDDSDEERQSELGDYVYEGLGTC